MSDLSSLLKKKKQDAIVLKISIEPTVEGEDLADENGKEGLAPPLEGKEEGGDGDMQDEAAEEAVEGLPMKDLMMDEAEQRRVSDMAQQKESGLLGKTSLFDKAKMNMMKKKV